MSHLTRRRLVRARARFPRCHDCQKRVDTKRNGYPYCQRCKTYGMIAKGSE
jgi:hypothetical protein